MSILCRGEQGACEENEAIGVLVMSPYGMVDEVLWIATDFGHRTCAIHHETVSTLHGQVELQPPDGIHGERFIEQTNEGTDRARRIVVLGLRQEQRTSAFEVA